MLRRLLALCLVTLALSPFSAPFCTCDLATAAALPDSLRQHVVGTQSIAPVTVDQSLEQPRFSEPTASAPTRFRATSDWFSLEPQTPFDPSPHPSPISHCRPPAVLTRASATALRI
jgi:hypothetical protein